MTIVYSQLWTPDGQPLRNRQVEAVLHGPSTWLADGSGRLVADATTTTDDTGRWQLDLIPCTRVEYYGHNYYVITESGRAPHYCEVPESVGPVTLHSCLVPEYQIRITWTPDPDDLHAVYLTVSGHGPDGATLDLGDGSPPILVTDITPIEHTYPSAGTYTVTGTDIRTPAITGRATVTVKDHLPRVHPFVDSDDPWRCLLWINEPADGAVYTVDWDDGSPTERHGGQVSTRVPPHPRVPHDYTAAHQYLITVTDQSTQRHSHVLYHAGMIGLLISYDDPERARFEAIWLASGATWEMQRDNDPPYTGIVSASGRVTQVGPVTPPGDYLISVREIIDGTVRRTTQRRRIQPTQWDWRMDVDLTWRDPGDPPGRHTVTVTPKGARTPSTVEWGDGTPNSTVNPGDTVTHLYQFPTPAAGWRLRVTETGIADPRTWTRLLAEPRGVGQPVLSARTGGAVDLDVLGADQLYNDDWYSVTWEEGGHTDPLGAVGYWYPANHVYNSPGHKVITVDGPGLAKPITREVDVVTYPTPVVTVTEAVDAEGKVLDPNRMTVTISTDNTASGGPCWVRAGDGTLPRLHAEVDSHNHTYPASGTFYAIASSQADPSAKGRMPVTVPFASTRTLVFEISGIKEDGKPDIYLIKVKITGKLPGKPIHVRWEAGSENWDKVPPSDEVTNRYPPMENRSTITVAYEDNAESWLTTISLPWKDEP